MNERERAKLVEEIAKITAGQPFHKMREVEIQYERITARQILATVARELHAMGWRIVPAEATLRMQRGAAGRIWNVARGNTVGLDDASDTWRDMLAAAPPSPLLPRE